MNGLLLLSVQFSESKKYNFMAKILSKLKNIAVKAIQVAAAFSPRAKALATAVGISAGTFAAVPEVGTLEQKIAAIASALVVSGVHKLCYLAKDYLDNGKLDKSVVEEPKA